MNKKTIKEDVATDELFTETLKLIKQYMLDAIQDGIETRQKLKNKYPELFSLYDL